MIVKCELDSGEKYSYSGNLIQFDEVNESELRLPHFWGNSFWKY
ncbi:MAG: hypothetical protein CM1200mP3_10150 [Chloroflexota bacterium]|nr:MAG: hypothetical protein CM1200mP3_10150 [Chloroflexota bacterium]